MLRAIAVLTVEEPHGPTSPLRNTVLYSPADQVATPIRTAGQPLKKNQLLSLSYSPRLKRFNMLVIRLRHDTQKTQLHVSQIPFLHTSRSFTGGADLLLKASAGKCVRSMDHSPTACFEKLTVSHVVKKYLCFVEPEGWFQR